MFFNALFPLPTPNGDSPFPSALFPTLGTDEKTITFSDLFAETAMGADANILPPLSPPPSPADILPMALSLDEISNDTLLLPLLDQWQQQLGDAVETFAQANTQQDAHPIVPMTVVNALKQLRADVQAVIQAMNQSTTTQPPLPTVQKNYPQADSVPLAGEAPPTETLFLAEEASLEHLQPATKTNPTNLLETVTRLQASMAAVATLPVLAPRTSSALTAQLSDDATVPLTTPAVEKHVVSIIRTTRTLQPSIESMAQKASIMSAEAPAPPAEATPTSTTATIKPDTFAHMMESLSPRDTASNNSFIQWQNSTTHSTNTTAPPPPTSFTPQAVPEQISFHLKKALADGVETLKISLKPASLGHVQVDMQVDHDGVLKAVISVEKPETLELLQRDARVLERALSDAGMKIDSNSLQFNLKQEQGFGQDFAERERTNSAPHTEAPLPDAPITDNDFIPTITHHYDGTLMRVNVMA